VKPTAQVDVPGLVVCVMATCKSGGALMHGCGTATAMTGLDSNTVGCCGLGTAPVKVDYECLNATADDSAKVTMRVKRPAAATEDTCLPYKLTYEF
jgi:hypothetical protein